MQPTSFIRTDALVVMVAVAMVAVVMERLLLCYGALVTVATIAAGVACDAAGVRNSRNHKVTLLDVERRFWLYNDAHAFYPCPLPNIHHTHTHTFVQPASVPVD